MHLDGALETPVVGVADVGIAAAAMGETDDIVLAFAGERLEQLARGGAVGAVGVASFDEGVRRAPDGAALGREVDVAVAAERGIAGPFVARQGDEPAGFVETPGDAIELGPEGIGDLEVVALVAAGVDEGAVAGERSADSSRRRPRRLCRAG